MFGIASKAASARFVGLEGKVTFIHKKYISVSSGCRKKS